MQAANPSARQPANAASRIAALFADHPVVILACYFAVQAVIRTWLGAPANLDEAEQLAIADRFSFGYGAHPPLYQWLQTAAFKLLGVNFLAIALVKNAILFATFATVVLLALEVTGSRQLAAIAGFGLLFSANFSWESQIDHTHTVTNTLFVVASTLTLFKLVAKGTLARYMLLGLCIGLGMLAKYNYALFLVAALLTFAHDRDARKIFRSRWLGLSLAVAVIIAGPHYLYIAENPVAGAAKLSNLAMNRYGFLQSRLVGITALLTAFAGVHAVWLGLAALGWFDRKTAPRALLAPPAESHAYRSRLMLRLWAVLLCVFAGLVVLAGTTSFRDHWLQPESVFFPLVMAIVFARHLDQTAFRRLAVSAVLLMALIPFAVIANKRLFPGAQRDADMPDPLAIARIEPLVASGQMPLYIVSSQPKANWYCAAHLRYWLQIPVPIFAVSTVPPAAAPHALLFQSRAGMPGTATTYATPVPVDFFRPQNQTGSQPAQWFLAIAR